MATAYFPSCDTSQDTSQIPAKQVTGISGAPGSFTFLPLNTLFQIFAAASSLRLMAPSLPSLVNSGVIAYEALHLSSPHNTTHWIGVSSVIFPFAETGHLFISLLPVKSWYYNCTAEKSFLPQKLKDHSCLLTNAQ